MEIDADDGTKEDAARAAKQKEINKDIRDLKTLPEEKRKKLGLDLKIKELEQEREEIGRARREAKPANERLTQAQAHEKNLKAKAHK
eukprot:3886361-Karenia_brevis.AAC.1